MKSALSPLAIAAALVFTSSLLSGCENYAGEGTLEVYDHLYLHSNGVKYEIGVTQDASGDDVVTATRVAD